MSDRVMNDELLSEWAEYRCDDAGWVTRELIKFRWKEIDDAPKDRYFLAWDGVRTFVCEWGNLYKRSLGGQDKHGWVNVYWPAGNEASPTHWMELPKPPEEPVEYDREAHKQDLIRRLNNW